MSANPEEARKPVDPPGAFILAELEARGWGQDDLARILNRPASRVSELIKGKLGMSPEMAVTLAAALGGRAEDWLSREAAYRLSLAKADVADVQRRVRLYQMAPIKDMQRRGWISATDDLAKLESQLLAFFEINSVDDEPTLAAMMKKSQPQDALNPAQKAWCFRVRQIARALKVAEFKEERLPQCEREIRKAAAYSQETAKAPKILASYGIRLIVVEPLAGLKIDGMATWLDDQSPVIGLSLRFDRIDSFWHTLCHEFRHVVHKDALSVDVDIADPQSVSLAVLPEMERRADREASAMLIPQTEMESFIQRVGPLYSKERINQFANRIKMHPGVIVGQLQHRKEITYAANREMLVKVRNIVAPAALTDGWGHTIDPRVFE